MIDDMHTHIMPCPQKPSFYLGSKRATNINVRDELVFVLFLVVTLTLYTHVWSSTVSELLLSFALGRRSPVFLVCYRSMIANTHVHTHTCIHAHKHT